MSVGFRAVQWNRSKIIYDVILVMAVALFIDVFLLVAYCGYQYRLVDGCAPPPFTERLSTYRVRIRDGIVEVQPEASPPGTPASITCPAIEVSQQL
jgi:hypothetical protein